MSESEAPRKRGRPKGSPVSAAQRSALDKGRKTAAANKAKREAARAEGQLVGRRARLNKLISGELSVRELSDKELKKGKLHDGLGSFQGGALRIPPKIRDQMNAEYLRRVLDILRRGGATAADEMVKMMTAEGVDPSVRLRAQAMVLERVVGKVPDVVHIGAETEFDRLQQGVFEFDMTELEDKE